MKIRAQSETRPVFKAHESDVQVIIKPWSSECLETDSETNSFGLEKRSYAHFSLEWFVNEVEVAGVPINISLKEDDNFSCFIRW